MASIAVADFEKVTARGIEAKKKEAAESKADEKADKSVQHTLLRKEKLPPTQAELKQAEKAKNTSLKEDTAWADKNRIAAVKTTCTRYVNHFSEKYPEIKKFPKPAEKDGLDEWSEYLRNLQSIIGGVKSATRFDSMLFGIVSGVEHLNAVFPEAFAGYNICQPHSLAKAVMSPQFLEEIDDEKHEIIFTHQSWFSSGHWTRLAEALGRVGLTVAMANKQATIVNATSPSGIERLVHAWDDPDSSVSLND